MSRIIFFLLIIINSISIYSQITNEKAKLLYNEALQLHNNRKYIESNSKLKDAIEVNGNTNTTIQLLRIRNAYLLKSTTDLKREIMVYLDLNPNQDNEYREVLKYIDEIGKGVNEHSQGEDPNREDKLDKGVVVHIDRWPSFPGGETALSVFLSENVQYPHEAQLAGVQGRVICEFVVNTNGSIVDLKVVRSIHPGLDNEAIRVIQKMPKWIPATSNGKPIRMKFKLPINFSLK